MRVVTRPRRSLPSLRMEDTLVENACKGVKEEKQQNTRTGSGKISREEGVDLARQERRVGLGEYECPLREDDQDRL